MNLLVGTYVLPEPDTNSGSLRLFELIRVLKAQGHRVTVLAHVSRDNKYRIALEQLGVEALTDDGNLLKNGALELRSLLRARAFQCALLGNYHVFNLYSDFIKATLPRCRLLLDTIDLHYIRHARHAELVRSSSAYAEAKQVREEETHAILQADRVWVINGKEQETLIRDFALSKEKVFVVKNTHRICQSGPSYSNRKGIVFLGGHDHAPNPDAVHYFVNQMYPLLQRELSGVPFTILGARPPKEYFSYAATYSDIEVTGYVEDHRKILHRHRVGIAPLRFGAGMKGKIGEYLASGLPCVSTSVGIEGMSLNPGENILVAQDPLEFVREIVRVYESPELWHFLSQNGIKYIEKTCSYGVFAKEVHQALDSVRPTRMEHLLSRLHFPKRPSKPSRGTGPAGRAL